MRRYFSLMGGMLSLIAVACLGTAIAESPQNYIQECAAKVGVEYLNAVSNLLRQADARPFLINLSRAKDAGERERRLAGILIARMDHPGVFSDFTKWVADARKRADYGRGGFLSASLLQFTNLGPESKFTEEAAGTKLVGIIEAPEYRKVEKYTDEDVAKGKTRNAVARLAVVEYFLKFSQDFNDYYEMPEMLYTLNALGAGCGWLGKTKRPTCGVSTQDLIEGVYEDEQRPLAVRIAAVSLLPTDKLDKVAVAQMMVKALEGETLQDDQKYRQTAEMASEFLRLYGNQESVSALQTNLPHGQWKRELVEKTVKEISARTGDTPQGKVP